MTQRDRLRMRLLARDPNLRDDEIRRVLEDLGYVLRDRKGSHRLLVRPGSPMLTLVERSPLKSYQIDQVLDAIGDELESAK